MLTSAPAGVLVPEMLRLLPFLLMLAATAAHAQDKPPAASPPVSVTPAQAQQVLDVLKDDKKRAEFTATLEQITQAVAATRPDPKPAAALPLAPDSLGAQLVNQVTAALVDTGRQLSAAVESVNDLPVLQRWIVAQATDPVARGRIFDAAWKLLVVMALGIAADWGGSRALRPVWARLAVRVPSAEADAVQADADKAEEDAPEQSEADIQATALRVRHNRLNRAVRLLQRLPYVIGRLLLELVPVAAFLVVAYGALGTRLGEPATTRLVINAVATAYIVARVVLCLMHMLVSPNHPSLRLLNLNDWMADFVARWTWRITVVAVTGNAIAQIGLLFGMYRVAYDSAAEAGRAAGPPRPGGGGAAVPWAGGPAPARAQARHRRSWPGCATGSRRSGTSSPIFYIVALWVVWALELPDGYTRLLHFFVVTTAVAIVARLVGDHRAGHHRPAAAFAPETATRYPGLKERIGFYHPLLRQLITAVISVAAAFAMLVPVGLPSADLVRGPGSSATGC